MPKLTQRMEKLALLAGGSFKTIHDRIRIAGRLIQHLRRLNIQIKDSDTRDNSERQFRLRFCRNVGTIAQVSTQKLCLLPHIKGDLMHAS